MKLRLHHINLCTTNVPGMDAFYRDLLDMRDEPEMNALRVTDEGYDGGVAFLSDGSFQVHVAERDLKIGFRTGQAVNPLEKGHIAFRTDDIDAFCKRLDEMGVPYSDYGAWAMKGWRQVFFHDPEGNVVEVHQAEGEE